MARMSKIFTIDNLGQKSQEKTNFIIGKLGQKRQEKYLTSTKKLTWHLMVSL